MNALKTKKDLAEITGMSVDYWDDQCAKRLVPFTRLGRKIFFTDEQIARIIAAGAVEPKQVPTRDEVARQRQQRLARRA